MRNTCLIKLKTSLSSCHPLFKVSLVAFIRAIRVNDFSSVCIQDTWSWPLYKRNLGTHIFFLVIIKNEMIKWQVYPRITTNWLVIRFNIFIVTKCYDLNILFCSIFIPFIVKIFQLILELFAVFFWIGCP